MFPPAAPMILSLCLLLPALSPSSQEICSVPGDLPAPTLYLSQTSAQQGDSVQLQCSVISQDPVTRIIFCKDSEEISSKTGLDDKVTYGYNHTVSSGSSGNYACVYETKNSDKLVTKSQLSPAKHLSVTWLDLKLLLGITIPDILVLAVVLYLLGKKGGNVSTYLTTLCHCLPVSSLLRDQREQAQCDTSNTPEDHVESASVDWLQSSKHPPPQTEETSIYMSMTLQQDRCH
ncbi:uncharacterized protein ACDP82_020282 [Pangshura tecta]